MNILSETVLPSGKRPIVNPGLMNSKFRSNKKLFKTSLLFQHSIKIIDVTEESINLIMAVQEICGSGNNFTFTHFVDIFKGKKTQKVVLHGKIYCYLFL